MSVTPNKGPRDDSGGVSVVDRQQHGPRAVVLQPGCIRVTSRPQPKHRGPSPRDPDWGPLGGGLGICISHTFPGQANIYCWPSARTLRSSVTDQSAVQWFLTWALQGASARKLSKIPACPGSTQGQLILHLGKWALASVFLFKSPRDSRELQGWEPLISGKTRLSP